VIFRSQKFELEFEASPRAANTNFSHGIAKYLKNLRNKKVRINIELFSFLTMIEHVINIIFSGSNQGE